MAGSVRGGFLPNQRRRSLTSEDTVALGSSDSPRVVRYTGLSQSMGQRRDVKAERQSPAAACGGSIAGWIQAHIDSSIGSRQDPIDLDSSPSDRDTISAHTTTDTRDDMTVEEATSDGESSDDRSDSSDESFLASPSKRPAGKNPAGKIARPASTAVRAGTKPPKFEKTAVAEAIYKENDGPVKGRTLEPENDADRLELFWALYPTLKLHFLPRYGKVLDLRLDLSYDRSIQRLATIMGSTFATIPQIGKNGWLDLMENWDLAWFDNDLEYRRKKEQRATYMTVEKRYAQKERSRPILVNTDALRRHGLTQQVSANMSYLGNRINVALDTAGNLVITGRSY